MSYLFYCIQDGQINGGSPRGLESVGTRYTVSLWHPKLTELAPAGMPLFPSASWWFFHQLRFFTNQDYGQLVIYDKKALVHRSGIFPRYPRFPFMAAFDLQIGDTWTAPDYRNQGLATYAVQRIVDLCHRPGRRFWYVVEQDNVPSTRVIERAGFTKVGEGTRIKRLGLGILGAYVILRQFPSTSAS